MIQGIETVILLFFANIMMSIAWYAHLKLGQFEWVQRWPLILVILLSWGIAFFEYCLQVPANRLGFEGNGGPFSLMQLKIIQEVITLLVFCIVFYGGIQYAVALESYCGGTMPYIGGVLRVRILRKQA